MHFEIVKGCDFNSTQIQAWSTLSEHAIEPNSYYEPWNLIPALEHFLAESDDVFHLLIYTNIETGADSKSVLTGFFPLQRLKKFRGLPVSCLRLWRHNYCFLRTPLINRDFSRETLTYFMDWLNESELSAPLFYFQEIAGDGPLSQRLTDEFNSRNSLTFNIESHSRAFLSRSDKDNDLIEDLDQKRRRNTQAKKLRNRRKALEKLGNLSFRVVSDSESKDYCIREFTLMEKSGWKGKDNSAIASCSNDAEYFDKIARDSLSSGKSHLLGLYLNDDAIAYHWNFVSQQGSFYFKPAFNEDYKKYSPGGVLEIDNKNFITEHNKIKWMDSCTVSDNELLNRMWPERRIISSILVSTDRTHGEFILSVFPLLRWLSRKTGR